MVNLTSRFWYLYIFVSPLGGGISDDDGVSDNSGEGSKPVLGLLLQLVSSGGQSTYIIINKTENLGLLKKGWESHFENNPNQSKNI